MSSNFPAGAKWQLAPNLESKQNRFWTRNYFSPYLHSNQAKINNTDGIYR